MYYKIIENGFIIAVTTGAGQTPISEEEYNELLGIFRTKPADPDGYTYMLRASDLQWELVEMPPEPEPDPEAEISDYEQALADLGVRLE